MSADPAAAPPPASDHCVKGILTSMASILNPLANEGANNRASININQNFPGNQLHGGCNFEYGQSCTGSADGGMGTQVNAGYMSWIMQPYVTHIMSKITRCRTEMLTIIQESPRRHLGWQT